MVISKILKANANSKARTYLINDESKKKEEASMFTRVCNTLYLLGTSLPGDEITPLEGKSFNVEDYSLPNTPLKTALESTHVYLNSLASPFMKPIVIAKAYENNVWKACDESDIRRMCASPDEIVKFFNEYYGYLGRNVEFSKFQNNTNLTINDLDSFKDSEGNIVRNGGTVIPETICAINDYQIDSEGINFNHFSRLTNWIDFEDERSSSYLINLV